MPLIYSFSENYKRTELRLLQYLTHAQWFTFRVKRYVKMDTRFLNVRWPLRVHAISSHFLILCVDAVCGRLNECSPKLTPLLNQVDVTLLDFYIVGILGRLGHGMILRNREWHFLSKFLMYGDAYDAGCSNGSHRHALQFFTRYSESVTVLKNIWCDIRFARRHSMYVEHRLSLVQK